MPHIGFRVSLSLREEFVLKAQGAEGADMRTKERQEVENEQSQCDTTVGTWGH